MKQPKPGLFDHLRQLLPWVTKQWHSATVETLRQKLEDDARTLAAAEFKRGRAEGRTSGIATGRTTGLAEGRTAGLAEGRSLGHAAGVRAARKAHAGRIRKQRGAAEAAARDRSRWLVMDKPVGITDKLASAIRSGVEERVSPGPEAEQWKMILSDAPATYVVAGAGSGKSTTLVLRVIALNQYRGISRKKISVFTFTKASRKDFIKKLRARLTEWDDPIDQDEAKRVVRTFHSMILRIARATIYPRPQVLEILDLERQGEVQDFDVENLLEVADQDAEGDGSPETPSVQPAQGVEAEESDKTPHLRNAILREAYERAFSESPEFRESIARVYTQSLCRPKQEKDEGTSGLIKWVKEHDATATREIEHEWTESISEGSWPLPGVEPVPKPVRLSTRFGDPFYVHGYIRAMDAFVVLCGAKKFSGDSKIVPSGPWINSKRKALSTISDRPIVWIDTVDELQALSTALKWFADKQRTRNEAPMFELIPPREYKRVGITNALFAHAQFIENLGLSVVPALAAAVSDAKAGLSNEDVDFAKATLLFWPYFETILKERDIWSFNQLFSYFSEDHPSHFEDVPDSVLGAMEHLMIDEFQDISPQIVKWVRGCKQELARRGRAGTLMCVGDDWQSIYGWRGSSPDFFVRFEHHFPAPLHLKLLLENNFRSSDNVLRCAESILRGVDEIEWKTCRAKGAWAEATMPVLLHKANRELPFSNIGRLIESEAKRTGATKQDPMLVLARGGSTLKKIRKVVHTAAVRTMTIHSAKGLESQSVVLLDDCAYGGRNPLRNFLYRQVGLGNYDVSQGAESRRLAYVGITRAMERCYWFAVPRDDGAFEQVPRAQKFAKKADANGKLLAPTQG